MIGQNKKIIKELFDEVLNRNKMQVLDKIIGRNYKDNSLSLSLPQGVEGIKMKLTNLRKSFSGLRFFLEDIISEKDLVAVRYYWTAKQTGKFMGLKLNGKKVKVKGMDFYRIKDGKIIEHWDCVDMMGLLKQIKSG